MDVGLRALFEERIKFRLRDGTEVDGGVFVGSTEFLPVEILRDDPDAYQEEFDLWLSEEWKPRQRERRHEILGYCANEKRYADLIAAVGRQQVVPFVGSGMSAQVIEDLIQLARDMREAALAVRPSTRTKPSR